MGNSRKIDEYPHPSLAADIVIFTIAENAGVNYRKLPEKRLEVLLIRRGIEPFRGKWALPGGFMRKGETIGETARRELEEETGAGGFYLEQLYTFSMPERDPRGWVVSCAHMALAPKNEIKLRAGDDAADAAWFRVTYDERENGDRELTLSISPDSPGAYAHGGSISAMLGAGLRGEPRIIRNDGPAFDHAKIIAVALERLRGKLDYTDIAFNLLPERFTLTELQKVYEIILGKKLPTAAFRRKIGCLVCETGMLSVPAGHRTSRLYTKNQQKEI
jgi:ADP-ribose pyrophosphatase YjhB (NUDIX family)